MSPISWGDSVVVVMWVVVRLTPGTLGRVPESALVRLGTVVQV